MCCRRHQLNVINYLRKVSPQDSWKEIANTVNVAHADWWYKTASTWQPKPSIWLSVPTTDPFRVAPENGMPLLGRIIVVESASNKGGQVCCVSFCQCKVRDLNRNSAVLLGIDFLQNWLPQYHSGPDEGDFPEIHQHFQEHHAVEQHACSQQQDLVLDLEHSRRFVLSTWWNNVPCWKRKYICLHIYIYVCYYIYMRRYVYTWRYIDT